MVYAGDGNSIQDRLECEGSVDASQSDGLNLDAGVFVSGAGSVHLGAGNAVVADATSGISGGQLTAHKLEVRNSDGTATFTQTGGTVSATVDIGRWSQDPSTALYGNYDLQDGQISTYGYVWADIGSTFEQSGGSVTASSVSVPGAYLLTGGSVTAGTIQPRSLPWTVESGTFTWTGGELTATEEVLVDGGTFEWVTTNTMDTPELALSADGTLVMARSFNMDDLATGASSLFTQGNGAVSLADGTLEIRGVHAYQQYETIEVGKVLVTEGASLATYIQPTLIAGEVVIRSGDWYFDGGTLDAGTVIVGPEADDNAGFTVYDGNIDIDNLTVGPGGYFESVTNTAIVVNDAFTLLDGSQFASAADAAVHVKGGTLNNQSTDDSAVAGLAALELVFEGTGNTFEVASEDVWPKATPWTDDFAIKTLHLVADAEVDLVDLFDNQLDGSLTNEAVYVTNLILDTGSVLNLNDLWLYYDSANSVINGTIVGDTYAHVPEPATLVLLAMGGLAVVCHKSRGRG